MNISNFFLSALVLGTIHCTPARAQDIGETVRADKIKAEQQQLLEEAEIVRQEAQRSVEEARQASAGENARHAEEMARMREQLSRVHRQLRDVSRQVAQAHRELESATLQDGRNRRINLGDRAILGVVLGKESEQGVSIIGVSPDGPAERAGLQQGDVLVSVGAVKLNEQAGSGRNALLDVMQGVSPGDELAVEILREGESRKFTVTAEQREPSAWQTVIRLPDPAPGAPGVPDAAGAPRVIVDRLEVPEIDETELASRIEEISRQVQKFEYMFTDENGQDVNFEHELELTGEPFSQISEHAMRTANIWFGLPQARGLELASLNPQLGKYFKAERGVLVIEARDDNAYGLESGDVIQAVGAAVVNSPADLLRVLRDAEPGSDIELAIRRHRRDQKLQAKVPENLLGQVLHHPVRPAAPPAPPKAVVD